MVVVFLDGPLDGISIACIDMPSEHLFITQIDEEGVENKFTYTVVFCTGLRADYACEGR